MKRITFSLLAAMTFFCAYMSEISTASAQGPEGSSFGFGIILGEPTGATLKFWTSPENAIVGDVGYSYFGAPRFDIDYIWHFAPFRSTVAKLYAGIGGALGLGNGYYGWYYARDDGRPFYYRYYYSSSVGFGIRAMFGLNVIPRRTPLEFFLEVGPLIGITPAFGVAVDWAIGVRFYP